MPLHNLRWMVDASINSGQLLENLPQNKIHVPEIMYPFDALYSFLAGEVATNSHHAYLPFGLPKAVHIKTDANNRVKKDSYRFRSTLDGRRITLTINELTSWLAPFSTLILPTSLAHLTFNKKTHVFIEINLKDIHKALATLSNAHGIAIHLTSEDEIDALFQAIKHMPERRWYVYGNINFKTFNRLSCLDNITLQSNAPFEAALNGFVYDNETPFLITEALYKMDQNAILSRCSCSTCLNHSRSYLHHLYKNTPILAVQLMAHHNIHYWQHPA